LVTVQTGGNKQGCIGDFCTFHKEIMYNNTLISSESQYSCSKCTERMHDSWFTADKIPFPGLHYTPDQDFNMKTNRGGEDFPTQNMHIMKVTLWNGVTVTMILGVAVSEMDE
jgi:hypothetical protein